MSDHHHHHDHCHSHGPGADAGKTVVDPVCGMSVNPATAHETAEHDGQSYYFCSTGCRTKFQADPDRYLNPAPAPAAPEDSDAIYTCPMHPQIRQAGPGSCPICGMALEPEVVTADSGPNPELADMTRRFWVGLALAAPVFGLEMGAHLLGHRMMLAPATSNWIQFALASPVVLWAGAPFFARGWASPAFAQPQYVHPDRHGRRRGLALQRRRGLGAGDFPGSLPAR
jgi:Cu+-exporting ATPase